VLKSFTQPEGGYPRAGLVLSDNTLYGTTANFGTGGKGVVFKINTDGSGYAVLHNFTGGDGYYSQGDLVLAGSTLYGTTEQGGASNLGVVFKVNTDGSGFTVLKSFASSEGSRPRAGLVLEGSTLYGTTYGGGISDCGVVFKVNTDGSDYAVLKYFTNFVSSDGAAPQGGLVLAGSTLYGTASRGGAFYGVVFKLNTDGSGYTLLHNFNSLDGWAPVGRLVLAGSTLYGTAGGGTGNYGVVYKVNTDGSGYTLVKTFDGTGGYKPYQGLAIAGSTLYGISYSGGVGTEYGGYGMVFRINADGSGYTVLRSFSGSDGGNPVGVMISGSTLYGTTEHGGSSWRGAVFSGACCLSLTGLPLTQTAEAGSTVVLRSETESFAPGVGYQWSFGTQALAGATRTWLTLTNVDFSPAGAYSVVVTNLAMEVVTSPPAMLSVTPPVPRRTVPAISLSGEAGSWLQLEYASTPGSSVSWQDLDVVSLAAPPQFYFDLTLPPPGDRFYRAWQTNVPSVRSALQLSRAAGLTLTGAIGNKVRVDCINQFGPTDAWVTLGTVTLTNTSQLYFDVSAYGQPPRLYRLMRTP
jgi:uncharacterized repeat protein (TIGR03803 family)